MAFTEIFNGNVYTEANLEGNAYADESTGFRAMMHDAAVETRGGWLGTSPTSLTIGLGTKSFTITTGGLGFEEGQPVRIADKSAPDDNYMDGTITVWDGGVAGSITVEVDGIGGSGTFTLWSVFVMRSKTTAASTPATEAQGGTAATTFAGARINMDLGKFLEVADVDDNPTTAEVTVASYGSDDILVPNGGSGAFNTHDWELAHLDSPGVWSFTLLTEPTYLWSLDANELWVVYDSSGEGAVDLGEKITNEPPSTIDVGDADFEAKHDPDRIHQEIFHTATASRFITLPNPGRAGHSYRIWRLGTGASNVNVSGGGTINGSSSIAVSAVNKAVLIVEKATGEYYGSE